MVLPMASRHASGPGTIAETGGHSGGRGKLERGVHLRRPDEHVIDSSIGKPFLGNTLVVRAG